MAAGRASRIRRLPADQRALIERLLREDRHTLDEMIDTLRSTFPATEVSRSSLHRYQSSLAELSGRMREIDRAASALVGELGEDMGEKAGALLVQAVTTLATHAALRAHGDDDTSIDDVRKLAQATKAATDSHRLSFQTRQQIRKAVREETLLEQRQKLEALGKSGAIDPAVVAVVIKAAYDL